METGGGFDMYQRALFGLATIAGALYSVTRIEAAPPPTALNNPFPASFYGFNPGYYGPYYPGHYQYGNVQPNTYNNYRSPISSGYGLSGTIPPLFPSSQPYGSPSTVGSTPSWSRFPVTSPPYRIAEPSASASVAPERPQTAVLIQVHVPAPDAELWVEGRKTASRGNWRQFLSPPLIPGKQYVYEVRAQWLKDGREIHQNRKVAVRAGEQAVLDFTRPEQARTASAPSSQVGASR
jgi:uncharacterized protein (TIGR03000 family)